MTYLRVAPALLLALASFAPPGDGQQVPEERLPDLLNEQLRAAELYQQGRLDEALEAFDRNSPSLNEQLAGFVLSSLQRRLRLRTGEGMPEPRPWTPGLAHALAALHMESALRAYQQRESADRVHTLSRTGRKLFSFLASRGEVPADGWARWTLAIGGTASADGQLWWAAEILSEPCNDFTNVTMLLVACGSVHEALAALPAHILLAEGRQSGITAPEFGIRSYQDAEARRRRHLGIARSYFEGALRSNKDDPEARLRLAWVQLQSGDAAAAAAGLENLLNTAALDRRGAFLVRLFLGRARETIGDLTGAIALFREALTIVPSAQSAHVALAAALHRQGAVREGAGITRRLFESPPSPPDLWSSYHYGQFWTVEPLLARLRSEARQ